MVHRQPKPCAHARPVSVWPISGWTLAVLITGASIANSAAAGPVLPTNGQLQAGSVGIGAPSGSILTINQSSNRAIIDWSSFSIGFGGTVQFNNGTGATLNRVTGTSGSAIDGLLNGTGSVYLINPNGVIIGKSGVVNVGGTFVASTLDLTNNSFVANVSLTFTGASTAAVINYGKVGSLGGDVALIAARVENHGEVDAASGDAGLLAGFQVTLRDRILDDGKFAVLVGGQGTSATNAGAIQAAEAEIRANGGNIYALAGDTDGVIRATGVTAADGKVFLVAEGGSVTARGEIDATKADGRGGLVETSGATVAFSGLTVKAGDWLIDPVSLVVDSSAAATIDANLATTDVTLKTTATGASGPGTRVSGAGDIQIDSALPWSSARTLTLDAYRSVVIDGGPMTIAGPGGLRIVTNDGGAGGDLVFTGVGSSDNRIQFTAPQGSGQSLTINGKPYQLVYSLADIAATANGDSTSAYALARPVDGARVDVKISVATTLKGTFEGLGNLVGNFTLDGNFAANGWNSQQNVGLFGDVQGTVRDLSVLAYSSIGFQYVGILAGSNHGRLFNDYAQGATSGWIGVGTLAGLNAGTIDSSRADGSVTVTDMVVPFGPPGVPPDVPFVGGGLAGYNYGTIRNSSASGSVTSPDGQSLGGLVGGNSGVITGSNASDTVSSFSHYAGGLVGGNSGTISFSYATGAVTGAGTVGGLVGQNDGEIANSYATGSVTGIHGTITFPPNPNLPDDAQIGGLVGLLQQGSVTDSYATGAVSGAADVGGLAGMSRQGSIVRSYADGAVAGQNFVGGLVGLNQGSIADTNAGGPVSGQNDIGGLVGQNGGGAIARSYATGAVAGSSLTGGLLGENVGGSVVSSYWDTQTTGRTTSAGGIGLTSAQLESSLPAAFLSAVWGQVAGRSFPYLLWRFPDGAPDVVSGTVYAGVGGSPLAGLEVDGQIGGADLGQGASGANGSYQLLLPHNSLQNAGLLTYLTGSFKGNTYEDGAVGAVSDMNVYAGALSATTGATTVTALFSRIVAAQGSFYSDDFLLDAPSSTGGLLPAGDSLMIKAAGSSFSVDSAIDLTGGSASLTAAGALSVKGAISSGDITLTTLAGGINLRSGLTASGTVKLRSAGGITDGGPGYIAAATLTGQANGAVNLIGSNRIANLAGFTDTAAGGISLRDITSLSVTGPVDAETGALTINQQTSGGLRIKALLISGGAMTLTSGGAITESGAGRVVTPLLNVTAVTGISLAGPNSIGAVGTNHTDSGPDVINGVHP
jgi:filamentous hemagglutinin family protein